MLHFRSEKVEQKYGKHFNIFQARNDMLSHAVTIFLSTYIIQRMLRSETKWGYRAVFYILFIGEKVDFSFRVGLFKLSHE